MKRFVNWNGNSAPLNGGDGFTEWLPSYRTLFPAVALPCWQKIGFPFHDVEPEICALQGKEGATVNESVFIPMENSQPQRWTHGRCDWARVRLNEEREVVIFFIMS